MVTRKRPNFVGVWLGDVGKNNLDSLAQREGLSKSEALRLMLAYATRQMPKGWRPR